MLTKRDQFLPKNVENLNQKIVFEVLIQNKNNIILKINQI